MQPSTTPSSTLLRKYAPLLYALTLASLVSAVLHGWEYWQKGDPRSLSKMLGALGMALLTLGPYATRYPRLYAGLVMVGFPVLLASIGLTLYPYFSS